MAAARVLTASDPAFAPSLDVEVLRRFAWADGISAWLSDAYRGGMTANFVLAACAVVVGLAYQPLTRSYRVSFGGLSQNFDSAAEAVAVVRRMAGWRLAEPGQLEASSKYYVEFSYKLDTTLLPRPMQIGIGGQPEWLLQLEKVQRLPAP